MALLNEGAAIRDTYEIERFLGEGAFAEVYRVRHRYLGRQALKLFKLPGLTTVEVQDMLGEAVLLSKIDHPNIVRVFDANTITIEDQVFGYFTMEHVAGGSLDRFWRSFGAQFVPVPIAVDLVNRFAAVLPPLTPRTRQLSIAISNHRTSLLAIKPTGLGRRYLTSVWQKK